jgi:hypothetical protein
MSIETIKEIEIGSSAFFKQYDDYNSKDLDLLNLVTDTIIGKDHVNMRIKENNILKDIFLMKIEDKDTLISKTINANVPLRVGKFIVPEFAKYINLTIDDLKKLKPLFDKLDDHHKYEVIIYNSYIENNDFTLNDEQRLKAYKLYKETKNNK